MGGSNNSSSQVPTFALPSSPKETRTLDVEFLPEDTEWWSNAHIQTEEVDTGYTLWKWELSVGQDNLQIVRTKTSKGKMEGLAASTGMLPANTSKPTDSTAGPTTIWKTNYHHQIKCLIRGGTQLYIRIHANDALNPNAVMDPIGGKVNATLICPTGKFQLYHGALSSVLEDGSRVLHTPVDPAFEEAQKQLKPKN